MKHSTQKQCFETYRAKTGKNRQQDRLLECLQSFKTEEDAHFSSTLQSNRIIRTESQKVKNWNCSRGSRENCSFHHVFIANTQRGLLRQ